MISNIVSFTSSMNDTKQSVKTLMHTGVHMYTTPERRAKPRIECECPALLEGADGDGSKYNDQAKLVNLSAGGLYMLVNRDIELGSKLDVTVILANPLLDLDAPKLVTNGIVVRKEPQPDGSCGLAIKFYRYRFQ